MPIRPPPHESPPLTAPRPRPRAAGFFRIPFPAALFALMLAGTTGGVRAAEPEQLPEEGQIHKERMFTLLEAGSGFAIGSKLGSLPQLGIFRDLPGAWQAGAQARFAIGPAVTAYDYRPLASLSLRKLWFGDEDTVPIRNSEYFGIGLGIYYAYDFDGTRLGARPMGSIDLGKYWMPFESHPLGLDLNIDLTSLKLPFLASGHMAGQSEQVVVTFGVSLFYAIP
jgi:hypothetical protein